MKTPKPAFNGEFGLKWGMSFHLLSVMWVIGLNEQNNGKLVIAGESTKMPSK